MDGLKEIFTFLFKYNMVYFLIIPTLFCSYLTAFRYVRRTGIDIVRKVILYSIVGVVCIIIGYMTYKMPIVCDKVVVDVTEENCVTVCEVHSQYRKYFYEKEDNITPLNNSIKVPVGKERKIVFLTGPEYSQCIVHDKDEEISVDLNGDRGDVKVCILQDSSWIDILKDYMVKIPICLLLNWIFVFGCTRIICNKEIPVFFKDNQWGILMFGVLIIHFLCNRADSINDWVACWYAMDYSMAFGSRFFIGEVLSFFYDDYLDAGVAYRFYSVFLVFLIGVVSYLFNFVIKVSKRSHKERYIGIAFLSAVWLVCPGSIESMWTSQNYGRLEMYTLLLTLLGVIAFNRMTNTYRKYFCIILISVISCAIYQGYVFLYYPIFLMVMICDIIRADKEKSKCIVLSVIDCFVTGISFLIWMFCTHIPYENTETLLEVIKAKTNLVVQKGAIEYEFFSGMIETYNLTMKNFFENTSAREKFFVTICLLLPVIMIIYAIYLKCFSILKESQIKRIQAPYIYFLLVNLCVVPQFMLNIDWERWLIALTTNFFFGIFYLSFKGYREMDEAIQALGNFVEKNRIIGAIVLIYLAGFDKFQAELRFAEHLIK